MVLSVVDREDTYGYEITQFIRSAVDVSESTLYPVLKRLQKTSRLKPTIKEYMGRNRRYYHVTPKGEKALEEYRREWKKHKNMVDRILLEKGGEKHMNRLEYLTQLRRSLEDGGLAEDEINDAMGFYEEIFLDAGATHGS